jgi:hypothetical protein
MAYPGEPHSGGVPPTPPTRDSWWPIIIALGVLAAFAYWFFSIDWEQRFQPTQKPSARPGAAHTDQRHLKELPSPPGVTNPTQQPGATR